MSQKSVVVLGATNKTDRYSYMALSLLKQKGYNVIPVHPKLDEIEGDKVIHDLKDINDGIYTITLYINPTRLENYIDDIVNLKPERVFFNPGTYSQKADNIFQENNIKTKQGCTIVTLKSGQFEL